MTKEEAFAEYEEALAIITEEFDRAKAQAKATLNTNLRAIRAALHEELKAVRAIQQSKGR